MTFGGLSFKWRWLAASILGAVVMGAGVATAANLIVPASRAGVTVIKVPRDHMHPAVHVTVAPSAQPSASANPVATESPAS